MYKYAVKAKLKKQRDEKCQLQLWLEPTEIIGFMPVTQSLTSSHRPRAGCKLSQQAHIPTLYFSSSGHGPNFAGTIDCNINVQFRVILMCAQLFIYIPNMAEINLLNLEQLHVQLISLNRNPVNRNFRKWVGCEALAPIQDNGSLR